MEGASRPVRLRFGDFEVDRRTGELRRRGLKMRLHRKSARVLLALLERPGEVLPREHLQRRVWPDGEAEERDNTLNNAVSRLRTVLGDTADNPRFIETVPRRGYRFIAPVLEDAPAASPPETELPRAQPPSRSASRWGVRMTAGLAAIALVAAAVFAGAYGWRRAGEPADGLAVLPLRNLSGDQGQDYVADGITQALVLELSSTGGLRVVSRTSTSQYKGTGKPLRQIGRELAVAAVVDGTVERQGDRVRITVQLASAGRGPTWTRSYERELRGILDMQRELANAIAADIRSALDAQGVGEQEPVGSRGDEPGGTLRAFPRLRTRPAATAASARASS